MSRVMNANLHPHAGFVYKNPDGVVLSSDSWAGVIARVKLHRKRAGLEPGNPEKEVMEYACSKNPSLCRDGDETYREKLKITTLKSRVLAWLALAIRHLKAGKLEWSAQHVAARSHVCYGCPHNRALEDSGCGSCVKTLAALRQEAAGIRPYDARLHCCSILGEDLNASVWLERETAAVPELPDFCWRKRTLG